MNATQEMSTSKNIGEFDAAQTIVKFNLSKRSVSREEFIEIANIVAGTNQTRESVAQTVHDVTGRRVFICGVEYRGQIMNAMIVAQTEGSDRTPKNVMQIIE